MPTILAIVGMLVCTGGGLLSLTPSPERPLVFIPVYLSSLLIFNCGLAMILWCSEISGVLL